MRKREGWEIIREVEGGVAMLLRRKASQIVCLSKHAKTEYLDPAFIITRHKMQKLGQFNFFICNLIKCIYVDIYSISALSTSDGSNFKFMGIESCQDPTRV